MGSSEGRVGDGESLCALSILCRIVYVLRRRVASYTPCPSVAAAESNCVFRGGPCWALNSWKEGPGNGTNEVDRNRGRSGTEHRVPQLSCARGSELQQGERRILAGPAAGARSRGLPARSGGRESASSTWIGWGDHSRRRSPRHQFVLFLRNGRRRPSIGRLGLRHPR